MPTKKGLANWFDAKSNRTVSVTKEDLKKAVCKDHQNCVIAKAIKRQMNAEWVDVGATTVLVKPWGVKRYVRYKLGVKAKEQVRFFDEEGKFAPCYVVLNSPCPSLKLGKQGGDNRKRKGGPRGHHGMHTRVSKPSR